MRPNAKLLIVACLLVCERAHAQTLIYSLTYTETTASFRAHFGSVPFPWRTPEQNLEMIRHTLKTEIYAVSVADGKRTLLFSDEGPHLEIQAVGSLTRAGKAYVVAFWRDWRGQPSPGSAADRAYYEIDLDGSKQFRKVAEAPAGQGPPVLNSQATRALVQGPNETYFVYSLPDWKLLTSWGLARITQAHCPLCTPGFYGWLADGNRLYFDLDVSGDETAEEAKSDHTGVYILSASGDDLGAIPPETGAFQFPGYVHSAIANRQFLGQLLDGRYLFLDFGMKQGTNPRDPDRFLVISSSNPALQRVIHLKFRVGGPVSPSGKYMAYLESRLTPDYRAETHLWVKDLESGDDKELLAVPPSGPPTSPEPNVGLSILGWIDD
jgi:hypothetical protein